jgi:hypothetical protein
MPQFAVPFVTDAKPYAGLAAGPAGFSLINLDGAWILDAVDEAAVAVFQAWYVAFDDLAYAKARAKERLEEERARRMNNAEVQGVQLGLLTEAVRLLATNSGTAFNSWGAVARNRMTAIRNRLLRIEQINTAADLIAGDIDALTDSYVISAFDVTTSARWPAI